jgi:DNA modification methylase
MTLHHGDCLAILPTLDAESIDAIVTDPPYGLGFMGKAWDRYDTPGAGGRDTRGGLFAGATGSAHSHGLAYNQPHAYQSWCTEWAVEAFRVAKPGAHLLAFGGTRTYHRLAAAIEDAGWEIRDTLVWAYASGFPKSLDVSKAIDKAAQPNIETHRRISAVGEVIRQHREAKGLTPQQVSEAVVGTPSGACWNWEHIQLPSVDKWPAIKAALDIPDTYDDLLVGDRSRFIAAEREVVAYIRKNQPGGTSAFAEGGIGAYTGDDSERPVMGAPATDAAREWQGWGTALKPAWEPIVMARKPLRGTVAGNVQAYGTGALNIDGCRIGSAPRTTQRSGNVRGTTPHEGGWTTGDVTPGAAARWPANVILTDPIFDGDTPGVVGGGEQHNQQARSDPTGVAGDSMFGNTSRGRDYLGDSGTYSRFFLIPKAPRRDREPMLGGLASTVVSVWGGDKDDLSAGKKSTIGRQNVHPTVKPTDLMRHLVRLVTPPGGVVLDPFLGSGTTALAAEMEGFGWVGIEREAEYVAIAEARLNGTQKGLGL